MCVAGVLTRLNASNYAGYSWLNSSHRAVVGIASQLLSKLIANEEISVDGLTLLRLCLSQLGATPVDASKITLPDEEEDHEDPTTKYFN
jgi:hypothetical protein